MTSNENLGAVDGTCSWGRGEGRDAPPAKD
jgi:hypothetical protein